MTAPEPSPPTVLTEDERAFGVMVWGGDDSDLDGIVYEEHVVQRILAAREAKHADRVAAAVQAERDLLRVMGFNDICDCGSMGGRLGGHDPRCPTSKARRSTDVARNGGQP